MRACNEQLATRGRYIFAQEVGESGTPHLQGCIHFEQKQRFTAVTKIFQGKGVHWEKCKGNWKQNVAYCTKSFEGDWSKIHGNIQEASRYSPGQQALMDMFYKDVQWKSWQKDVLAIIKETPDPRKIYWFWEPEGNSGKSFLARWIGMNYRCQIGTGKTADIFNGVAKKMEKDPRAWPEVIIVDIPRKYKDFVQYGAIEQMKNGFLYSGKYEGAELFFPPPHVICFANQKPDFEAMSEDRWVVRRIVRTVQQAWDLMQAAQ